MSIGVRWEVLPPRRKAAPLRRRKAAAHWRALLVLGGRRHHLGCVSYAVREEELPKFLVKAEGRLRNLLRNDHRVVEFLLKVLDHHLQHHRELEGSDP